MTPRIAKLIELETSGRIKPEHLQELNAYRAQGIAPPRPKGAPTADINRLFDNDEVLRQIGMARELVNRRLAGGANVLWSGVPNTESRDLAGTLSTIGSNITTGRLAQLKESSPTGASGFGSLTEKEGQLLRDAIAAIDQGQSDEKLLDSLNTIERRYKRLSGAMRGINPDEAENLPTISPSPPPMGGKRSEAVPPVPGVSGGNGPNPPDGGSPLSPNQLTLAQGGAATDVSASTRAMEGKIASLVASGASADDVREYIRSAGIDPATVAGIDEAVKFRADNPAYKGSFSVQLSKAVPMSSTEKAINSLAQSPVGAFAVGAGNAVTGGYLDELTPDPALSQAGKELLRRENPAADFAGNVAGGTAMGLGGELALARLGVRGAQGVLAPRALAADAGYGALYGSGESNDDRLSGAGLGALGGAGGGVAGRFLTNSVGRAISPTGGALRELYEAGVRPTLGQRFVNSGLVGNAVNATEEALQSIPLAGAAVRGARGKAREQFERGAFNSALTEIGDKLPDEMALGTEPHAYMQRAFSDAYDKARSGMSFVPDAQYQADRAAFAQELGKGVLSADQVEKVTRILDNVVTSRLQAGQGSLTGDAYKVAASELGKASKKLSAAEPLVADALSEYMNIFDDAARRSSSPEAVALLDAADKGYAKAVRIEQAAAARGANQEAGRFTPSQFDRAVQQASGGVRSRAYLRGDALMSDYAEAGKALSDRLPDSGTPTRLMTGALLGAGTIKMGPAFAVPVAATMPYMPVARDLATSFLAPRSSKRLRTLGELFKQNADVGGAAGVPALLGLTVPPGD
jgi:hypothetical protein